MSSEHITYQNIVKVTMQDSIANTYREYYRFFKYHMIYLTAVKLELFRNYNKKQSIFYSFVLPTCGKPSFFSKPVHTISDHYKYNNVTCEKAVYRKGRKLILLFNVNRKAANIEMRQTAPKPWCAHRQRGIGVICCQPKKKIDGLNYYGQ